MLQPYMGNYPTFNNQKMSFVLICSKDESEVSSEQGSTCIIRLNNSNILYLREITRFLVLVSVLRNEAFNRRGLFYNLGKM